MIRFLTLLLVLLTACTKPYLPPEIDTDLRLLVVDGVVNTAPGGVTEITLSRTRRIDDSTVQERPEPGAEVVIRTLGGASYRLTESTPGRYRSLPLNLSNGGRYSLLIFTRDGDAVESDYVGVKDSPPIDSLSWAQDGDVTVFASTHDPAGTARYYRWEYDETWEYRSTYESHLEYRNGQVITRQPEDYQRVCWQAARSNKVVLGSTTALAEDRVFRQPVALITQGDGRIAIRYSILVRQFALTEAAYAYWLILQKNSEGQGTIFDTQPAQLKGNFRSQTNPEVPVIGFLSAGSPSEARIFIKRDEVADWVPRDPLVACDPVIIERFQIPQFLASGEFAPAYFITGGGIAIAPKPCVDCTVRGGTNRKPLFW